MSMLHTSVSDSPQLFQKGHTNFHSKLCELNPVKLSIHTSGPVNF